jgi:hypothetical protein
MANSFENFIAARPDNYSEFGWHEYSAEESSTLLSKFPFFPDDLKRLCVSKVWQKGSSRLIPPFEH